MNSSRVVCYFICIVLTVNFIQCAARSYQYPQVRYQPKNVGLSKTFANTSATIPLSSSPSSSSGINTEKTNKILSRSVARLALATNCILSRYAQKDDNIIFSPLNIGQTLATVMLGSAGKTELELATLLGMGIGRKLDNRLPKVYEYLGNFFKLFTSRDSGITLGTNLNLAGGIFIQRGFIVKQSFIDYSRRMYNNDVLDVDFNNNGREAADIINKWVTNKTEGKITDIVEPTFDPTTKAIIVGALYFNGDWEYPFMQEFTKWQTFYLGADGKYGKENVLVEMMVNEAQLPYYEDRIRGFSAIGLPYKKKEIYMYIVLPTLRTDVKNVTNCMTPKEIDNIVEKSASNIKDVLYVMPKMKLDSKSNLRTILEKLGVRTIFDPHRANFSNMADGIYVSDMVHKVDVDINEIGTTAAAATSTTLNRGGYVNFRVDRPFIFFIYDTKVGSMTFWGVIRKPTPYRTESSSTT